MSKRYCDNCRKKTVHAYGSCWDPEHEVDLVIACRDPERLYSYMVYQDAIAKAVEEQS